MGRGYAVQARYVVVEGADTVLKMARSLRRKGMDRAVVRMTNEAWLPEQTRAGHSQGNNCHFVHVYNR
jgi:hypothetical protein